VVNQSILSHDLYPFQSRYFDLKGLQYHYIDEGKGSPVVMVHGNPTWSFYFRELVKDLRGSHRVIVPDHIGCGLSDKPSEQEYDYTLERRVNDLERLLDSLGVREKITLVLHDWGGMIGMTYADRHPERIRRIVLMNTGAFRLPKSKSFPWPLHVVRSPIGRKLVLQLNAFSRVASWVCARKGLSKKVRRAYTFPYNTPSNRIATFRFVEDIPLKPGERAYDLVAGVESRLSQFQDRPTLICWGERDFVFDRHFLGEWQRHLPQAKVHRFKECGHYVLDDAAPQIVPLVREFLEAHPV
jgi:cis-3-alkyl-4-acyloxetan-2-one decarboxylase